MKGIKLFSVHSKTYLKIFCEPEINFNFLSTVSDKHQNSEITELHRLRRELHEEQERVQRLSAQLSTNVRYLFI